MDGSSSERVRLNDGGMEGRIAAAPGRTGAARPGATSESRVILAKDAIHTSRALKHLPQVHSDYESLRT